jgi:hypothetical protein
MSETIQDVFGADAEPDHIKALRFRLEQLKQTPIGEGTPIHVVGQQMLDIADLNLQIAELLLSKS